MNHLTCHVRILFAVGAGCGLLLIGNGTSAVQPDDVKPKIQAIADAIKTNNRNLADNLVQKLIKENEDLVYDSMITLRPRDKQGFGVGQQAGQIKPDGIEQKLQVMSQKGVQNLVAEAPALEEMGYRIAAIALIARSMPQKKKQQLWKQLAEEMHDSSLELVKAVRNLDVQRTNQAVIRMNQNCNQCHYHVRGGAFPDLKVIAEFLEKGDPAMAESRTELLAQRTENVLLDAMKSLKPGEPDYHAFGIGKLISTDPAEGIEQQIHDLATRGIEVFRLVEEKKDLLEMGYRIQAVALLTMQLKKDKEQAHWEKYTREFHNSTQHFLKAVGTLKNRDVRRTAAKLEASCAQCHAKFR